MEHGGDGQATNCASRVVSRLKEGGDGFLAVRSGPSTQYRQVDQLHNGDVVFEFERRGAWVGVVYGISSIECHAMPYRKKGWVNGKWLKMQAD